jgi:hypothetical protein
MLGWILDFEFSFNGQASFEGCIGTKMESLALVTLKIVGLDFGS